MEEGNTEAMANMVAKGVEAAGATAKVVPVDGFNAEELKGESAFALGCPAMGDEVLERVSISLTEVPVEEEISWSFFTILVLVKRAIRLSDKARWKKS